MLVKLDFQMFFKKCKIKNEQKTAQKLVKKIQDFYDFNQSISGDIKIR